MYTSVFEIVNQKMRCEMFCGMSPLSVPVTGTFLKSPVNEKTGICTLTFIAGNGVKWTVICTFVAGAGLEVAGSGFQLKVPPQVPVAGTSRKCQRCRYRRIVEVAGLEVAGSGFQIKVPPQVPVAGTSRKCQRCRLRRMFEVAGFEVAGKSLF